MASATATAKSEAGRKPRRGRWRLPGSRLGRLIIALQLLGLAILIVGALVLNELRRGLINSRIDSLTTQGEFIANVIDKAATQGEPEPMLEATRAADTLQLLFIPRSQRARLFNAKGDMIADSYVIADRVEWKPLPPVRKPGEMRFGWKPQDADAKPKVLPEARAALQAEVRRALQGEAVAGVRIAENGDRVVSVSIPLQHVQAVLGVLTLEAGDVDEIIAAERRALTPFILIAIGVTLTSSFLLTRVVARPVLRLARAADSVRLSQARAISLPDLAARDDELGDLTRSLETMTHSLSERMDAIERFAADVAHEIKNPLTSIRSAVETLDIVKEPAQRERLIAILNQDVGRLDRLVTDISNASRLDAELSRERPRAFDLAKLLGDICSMYDAGARPNEPPIRFVEPMGLEPVMVMGREGPLGQVFRNLIDNARSFTPLSTGADRPEVRVSLARSHGQAVVAVEDDGPGVPPENLETVFERFYTSRPKGAVFGANSGLGLSIARQIVEAHDGRIRAENRADETGAVVGARFLVSLPEHRG
ncbi:histidine kinase [Caulobacter sp. CCUG 60055]|uniref:stimulus-sensing domain-containing protein n=1 Tax=Caulobacter sp. CCUG 60055 TaxID=2100090 RepID=UPI001FA6D8F4|nr:stimulus-sensing domain-containing protein [Caulobacter sp. CCUG 60055]MBQ1543137.1 sensor N-terminal transmembrane domain-containing protein [Caulobacteraceae bacterium]MCI3179963.1 histidine kinase [Caulobacter sp. CCUG 60055]